MTRFKSISLFVIIILNCKTNLLAEEAAEESRGHKFKVGVIAALSGPSSVFGLTAKNAIELADEINDRDDKVHFIFEDDQFSNKNTVSAVHKLIDKDHVDSVIVWGSPTALAINDIVESKKMPTIAVSLVEKVSLDKKFVMRLWVSSEQMTNKILEEIDQNYKYKNIALVLTNNDAQLRMVELFKKGYLKDNNKIVYEEILDKDNLDVNSVIIKIKRSKPDAVYQLNFGHQISLIAKKLRQFEYAGPIFGAHNFDDKIEIKNSEGALKGSWYVSYIEDNNSPITKAYREKYGIEPGRYILGVVATLR